MRRRSFIASCAAGAFTATITRAQSSRQSTAADGKDRAVAALVSAKRLQVSGSYDKLGAVYHSDAMMVDPDSLAPSLGRADIVKNLNKNAQSRKLLYFYYRQPEVMRFGNSAIVVSNYESGHTVDGKTVEVSGKTSNVVMLGPEPPLIALEMIVPNLHAGSYGALGTALAGSQLGVFPFKALGPAATTGAQTAGGGENDVLFKEVLGINDAWVSGDANAILKYAGSSGLVLIGDYSPYFITGNDQIKEHFADFYKTSKVNTIRALDPAVRIWDSVAAVEYTFNLDYVLGGKSRRGPGRAVYTFARGAGAVPAVAERRPWVMAVCATTHLVAADIGDPYSV
jgi:Domain of unknown function (DUF4440)